MSMESIRKQYQVPAKRGRLVRCVYSKRECKITSATRSGGSHLNVRFHNGAKDIYHPFELDYCVDGQWVLGKEKQRVYDHTLDVWFGSVKPAETGGGDDDQP